MSSVPFRILCRKLTICSDIVSSAEEMVLLSGLSDFPPEQLWRMIESGQPVEVYITGKAHFSGELFSTIYISEPLSLDGSDGNRGVLSRSEDF